MRIVVFAALLAAAVATAPTESAAAGFDPRIVTFGDSRDQIKSTPITQRPSRPLHVYGNSVRRRHQRSAAPTLKSQAGSTQR